MSLVGIKKKNKTPNSFPQEKSVQVQSLKSSQNHPRLRSLVGASPRLGHWFYRSAFRRWFQPNFSSLRGPEASSCFGGGATTAGAWLWAQVVEVWRSSNTKQRFIVDRKLCLDFSFFFFWRARRSFVGWDILLANKIYIIFQLSCGQWLSTYRTTHSRFISRSKADVQQLGRARKLKKNIWNNK